MKTLLKAADCVTVFKYDEMKKDSNGPDCVLLF